MQTLVPEGSRFLSSTQVLSRNLSSVSPCCISLVLLQYTTHISEVHYYIMLNSVLSNDARYRWCHDLCELSISLWEFIWGFNTMCYTIYSTRFLLILAVYYGKRVFLCRQLLLMHTRLQLIEHLLSSCRRQLNQLPILAHLLIFSSVWIFCASNSNKILLCYECLNFMLA